MTDLDLSKINKILIIRLSSLGDILLTTPLIRAVKTQFPKIKIDFILREEYSDVLKQNPHLNKIIKFSRNENENTKTLNSISKDYYDLILDLQNNLRSKKIISKFKAHSLFFVKNRWRKFLLVHFKVNRLENEPQIPVRYSQIIPKLKLDNKGLDLYTNNSNDNRINGSKDLIGICPGARHFTKRWPKEYFIELGNKLTEAGFTIVLFGGKIDREFCSEISKMIPGSIDLSNQDDILQTAVDMKLCKAVVCNDSGLMHTASAVGTKLIAIFGSTVREFGFTPYNCENLILENNSLNCRPCSHIGRSSCPKKHFDCMRSIKPNFVFEKLISFITA